MNTSVWSDTVSMPVFDSLKHDLSCDVLVIGGGMAGMLIADNLRRNGLDAVVAEAKTVGSGATKNTTAVISAQHDTLYSSLVSTFGADGAKQYLTANLEAVELFKERAQNCDLQILPSVLYTARDPQTLREEVKTLHQLGYSAEFVTDSVLPCPVTGGVKFPDMAQFHPLKFLSRLCENVPVYEHTFVSKIHGDRASTEHGMIRAKYFVIATHFPLNRWTGGYFTKMYQNRSYVLGLSHAQQLDATYVSYDDDGLYWRNYKDFLLLGGGDRRVGRDGCCYDQLRNAAAKYYPNAVTAYQFAAQDCMSLDGIPYIGQYGMKSNRFVATGFNEWGMTSSMVAAQIITGMIVRRPVPYARVFSPSRCMFGSQLFKNLGTTVVNLLRPTPKRCPHMGSSLKYNKAEDTWECACHGSRFNKSGELIDNPAHRDVNMHNR